MMGTAVANVNDANTGTPTLSGTQAEDETLTVDASPLTGNDEDGNDWFKLPTNGRGARVTPHPLVRTF